MTTKQSFNFALFIFAGIIYSGVTQAASVTKRVDFPTDFQINIASLTPSATTYIPFDQTYFTSAMGSDTQFGSLRVPGVPGAIASDLKINSLLTARIDSNGNLTRGTFAVIGSSDSLGIATGTTLLSATLSAAEFRPGPVNTIDLRARVDSISPALRPVVGDIKSVHITDFLVIGPSDPDFVNNPWNVFLTTVASTTSPDVFLSSSVLPLTVDEAFTEYFLTGSGSFPLVTYDSVTDMYSLSVIQGEPFVPGFILGYGGGPILVDDIVSTFSIGAEINDAGTVLGGTMSWIGESASLGIPAGSTLMAGTVKETYYGTFGGVEPKIEFVIDIDSQHPAIETVMGPQSTMIVHDFQVPPPAFIADPWSVSFNNSAYMPGPRIFTTSETFENADTDGDGIGEDIDNCVAVSNGDQRDADGDGIGSICDQDLNNDCLVNFLDVNVFRLAFGTSDANADFDGNGVVNFLDFAKIPAVFNENYSVNSPSAAPNICTALARKFNK